MLRSFVQKKNVKMGNPASALVLGGDVDIMGKMCHGGLRPSRKTDTKSARKSAQNPLLPPFGVIARDKT